MNQKRNGAGLPNVATRTTNKPRIAMLHWHVAPFNLTMPGGVLQVELTEAELLRQEGYQVAIYGREAIGTHPFVETLRSYQFAGHLSMRLSMLEYFARTLNVDVLHGHNNPIVARRFPKRGLVHFSNHPDNAPLTQFNKYIAAYQQAHYAFCSKYIQNEFERTYPAIPPDHCFVVYHGVDTEFFKPLPHKPSDEDGIKRLLFLAAWSPAKGLDVALDAIDLVKQKYPNLNCRWQIAGSTRFWNMSNTESQAMNEAVDAAARKYDNVEVIGEVPFNELSVRLAQADLYVIPARWPEPFSLINMMAMACGLPIISCPVGGTPEQIVNGEMGLLVPPDNPIAVADAVASLLTSPEKLEEMGRSARATAIDKFSWQAHIDTLTHIYQIIFERTNLYASSSVIRNK